VRTIEHGNLVDDAVARRMAERGAYMVPTLVTYECLQRRGPDYGLTPYSLQKNEIVLEAGLRSLELCRSAGVRIGFGTDLLGALQDEQCREFLIRAEAMPPHEVIRSATIVNAQIVQREGDLGELVPGAYADLLVVDGDPFRDLGVLQNQGERIAGIMKDGRWYKNLL
jgi:imidazolonepropionase-like amidohydrolase